MASDKPDKVTVIDPEGNEISVFPIDAREIVALGGSWPDGSISSERQAALNEHFSKQKSELEKEAVKAGADKTEVIGKTKAELAAVISKEPESDVSDEKPAASSSAGEAEISDSGKAKKAKT